MVDIQRDAISEAYEDVRNDTTSTTWLLLAYDENSIVLSSTGSDFEEFKCNFKDDQRLFGYLRLTTGEEPSFKSKRAKFVLITWIGTEVGALKRAKVSTDKSFVKAILQSYAVEIQTSDLAEVDEEYLKGQVVKAGGANYGTGTRND